MKPNQYCVSLLLTGAIASLSACSSSDDPSTPIIDDESVPPNQFRVVSVSDDTDNDGVVDVNFEFAYDVEGRVTTVTRTNTNDPSTNRVKSYTYQGDNLVSLVDGNDVFMYTIENGRPVAVEDPAGDIQRYTYDDGGNMVAVDGDAFFLDDDCDAVPIPGEDPEAAMPRYTLEYNAVGRLTLANGSEGDSLAIGYLANGNPDAITINTQCVDNSSVAQYSYDSDDLPAGAVITDEFGDITSELTFQYENSRLVSSDDTSINFLGEEEVIISDYSYSAEGRIEVVTFTGLRDEAMSFSSTRTFRYENTACVEQVFTNPVRNLLLAPLQPANTFEGGLRCGYLAELR